MTLRARLVTLFPLLVVVLGGATASAFVRDPSADRFAAMVFVVYLFPPLCFRLHNWLCPLRPGREDLSNGRKYSPWWGSQQFQIIYTVIPQLEMLLRLIPGMYSAWLRLWGSTIGRGIVWTPAVEVIDRSLLDIGDHVFFGHKVALVSHAVRPRRGRQVLLVARIHVGPGAFIGATSGLGPGARVAAGEFLPFNSRVYFTRSVG